MPVAVAVLMVVVAVTPGCRRKNERKLPTASAQLGELLINEVLYDPSGTTANPAAFTNPDVNGDGTVDFKDEFIEIVNITDVLGTNQTIDLTDWAIRAYDADDYSKGRVLHTFVSGDTLAPGRALVLISYQGTAPTAVGRVGNYGATTADLYAANYGDAAHTPSTGDQLGLNDKASSALVILDHNGGTVHSFAFKASANTPTLYEESWTRSPDGAGGAWAQHSLASSGQGSSPGTKADGSGF